MAEKETEQIQEIIENEEVKEEVKEETQEVKDEKSKQGVIENIKNKVKEFVSGNSGIEEKEGEIIPDDFTNAALNDGWDEETIMAFAADKGDGTPYTNEELLEMIPLFVAEDSTKVESPADKVEKTEKKVEDNQDGEKDEALQKALARIDALEKAQGKVNEETEQQKLSNLDKRASQIFDETSKEFEIFGTSDKLPTFPAGPKKGQLIPNSPAMKARIEVWGLAHDLHSKAGMDFDNAMSVSLNAFKGKNLAKDVKRNMIKDLKKNEKKLSGKHTTHESSSIIENGPDVIRAVVRKAGREIN